jgi:phosphatidate cytidylyltransferase
MLKQRVITALVLLALLAAVLAAPGPWPFALFSGAAIAAAGWEWGRLNGLSGAAAVGLGAVVVALCGAAAAAGWVQAPPIAVWWLALAGWACGGALAVRGGPAGWGRLPRPVRLATGALLLALGWLALAHARTFGLNFLLSIACLVWMADIAAYFGGRAIGGAKLAPSISPGKSWAGVWSGMAGVLLLGAVWWGLVDRHVGVDSASLYGRLADRFGLAPGALALLFLAAMSVIGDLVESLVKRSAGAKDSSALLPGHGGVLDRIDALLPVFPLALALAVA